MKTSTRWLMAAALGLSGGYVHAAPMPNVYDDGNRWLITAYNDSSPTHAQMATQGICFLPYAVVGTHVRGMWYSDTFPDWNGVYSQEGDQVFMHGDYAMDVGHDGIMFEIETSSRNNQGGGHWTEWRENGAYGKTIVFANAKLSRVGKCTSFTPTDALKLQIAPRVIRTGLPAVNPLDLDQLPIPGIELAPQ
ncbi:MAG: hypothetical protein AABZ84_10585 [Pseudomonadota bacterium]